MTESEIVPEAVPGTGGIKMGQGDHQDEDLIREGMFVVIERDNYMRTHKIDTAKNGFVQLGKQDRVNLDKVVGNRFGDTFKMVIKGDKDKGKRKWDLEKTGKGIDFEEILAEEEDGQEESGEINDRDNRDIVDNNHSQAMTSQDIEAMRESGSSGQEIIASLVQNSQSFQKKTKFSQAKFLKKKAKKYSEYLIIRRPTLRLLAQIQYRSDPMKVMNLRPDSLAQLLSQSGVRAGGNYIVYETGCQGLVVAGAMERIGDSGGRLVHVFQTGNPQTQCLNAMNFPKEVSDSLTTLNMYHLRSLDNGEDITLMHKGATQQEVKDSNECPAEQTLEDNDPKKEEGNKPSEQFGNGDQGAGGDKEQVKVPHRQKLREQSVSSYELMKSRYT